MVWQKNPIQIEVKKQYIRRLPCAGPPRVSTKTLELLFDELKHLFIFNSRQRSEARLQPLAENCQELREAKDSAVPLAVVMPKVKGRCQTGPPEGLFPLSCLRLSCFEFVVQF